MASQEYWAKRCAELEKYMGLNKEMANRRLYSTFEQSLAYAIREKIEREKELKNEG